MRILAGQGDWRAAKVEKILLNKDRLIGAILLGNNTVNTMAAAITTSVLIKIFGDAGIYYATIIITLILLIFSEVLPKTYALYHADKVARWVALPIHVLVWVATPITRLVAAIVRAILWVAGESIDRSHHGSDEQELRGAIELHQGPGDETRERREMLRSIMDLTEMSVEDIMIHRRHVNSVNFSQPTEQAVAEIMAHNHTRIPLWSGTPENIVGVVHMKQLLLALNTVKGDTAAIDLLSLMNRPWFIPNTTRLIDQLQAFRHRREHFAVVVDEYGSFRGVVTLEDILEVIVGDIHDEEDLMVPGIRKLPDGAYLVNGDLSLREINRQLGWRLPEDQDYTTLAGLVIYESRAIPEVGQSFAFHGVQFDIVKRQRHQISVLKIARLAA
jgi:Mg2+/Co2+ transporter CorB